MLEGAKEKRKKYRLTQIKISRARARGRETEHGIDSAIDVGPARESRNTQIIRRPNNLSYPILSYPVLPLPSRPVRLQLPRARYRNPLAALKPPIEIDTPRERKGANDGVPSPCRAQRAPVIRLAIDVTRRAGSSAMPGVARYPGAAPTKRALRRPKVYWRSRAAAHAHHHATRRRAVLRSSSAHPAGRSAK